MNTSQAGISYSLVFGERELPKANGDFISMGLGGLQLAPKFLANAATSDCAMVEDKANGESGGTPSLVN